MLLSLLVQVDLSGLLAQHGSIRNQPIECDVYFLNKAGAPVLGHDKQTMLLQLTVTFCSSRSPSSPISSPLAGRDTSINPGEFQSDIIDVGAEGWSSDRTNGMALPRVALPRNISVSSLDFITDSSCDKIKVRQNLLCYLSWTDFARCYTVFDWLNIFRDGVTLRIGWW